MYIVYSLFFYYVKYICASYCTAETLSKFIYFESVLIWIFPSEKLNRIPIELDAFENSKIIKYSSLGKLGRNNVK